MYRGLLARMNAAAKKATPPPQEATPPTQEDSKSDNTPSIKPLGTTPPAAATPLTTAPTAAPKNAVTTAPPQNPNKSTKPLFKATIPQKSFVQKSENAKYDPKWQMRPASGPKLYDDIDEERSKTNSSARTSAAAVGTQPPSAATPQSGNSRPVSSSASQWSRVNSTATTMTTAKTVPVTATSPSIPTKEVSAKETSSTVPAALVPTAPMAGRPSTKSSFFGFGSRTKFKKSTEPPTQPEASVNQTIVPSTTSLPVAASNGSSTVQTKTANTAFSSQSSLKPTEKAPLGRNTLQGFPQKIISSDANIKPSPPGSMVQSKPGISYPIIGQRPKSRFGVKAPEAKEAGQNPSIVMQEAKKATEQLLAKADQMHKDLQRGPSVPPPSAVVTTHMQKSMASNPPSTVSAKGPTAVSMSFAPTSSGSSSPAPAPKSAFFGKKKILPPKPKMFPSVSSTKETSGVAYSMNPTSTSMAPMPSVGQNQTGVQSQMGQNTQTSTSQREWNSYNPPNMGQQSNGQMNQTPQGQPEGHVPFNNSERTKQQTEDDVQEDPEERRRNMTHLNSVGALLANQMKQASYSGQAMTSQNKREGGALLSNQRKQASYPGQAMTSQNQQEGRMTQANPRQAKKSEEELEEDPVDRRKNMSKLNSVGALLASLSSSDLMENDRRYNKPKSILKPSRPTLFPDASLKSSVPPTETRDDFGPHGTNSAKNQSQVMQSGYSASMPFDRTGAQSMKNYNTASTPSQPPESNFRSGNFTTEKPPFSKQTFNSAPPTAGSLLSKPATFDSVPNPLAKVNSMQNFVKQAFSGGGDRQKQMNDDSSQAYSSMGNVQSANGPPKPSKRPISIFDLNVPKPDGLEEGGPPDKMLRESDDDSVVSVSPMSSIPKSGRFGSFPGHEQFQKSASGHVQKSAPNSLQTRSSVMASLPPGFSPTTKPPSYPGQGQTSAPGSSHPPMTALPAEFSPATKPPPFPGQGQTSSSTSSPAFSPATKPPSYVGQPHISGAPSFSDTTKPPPYYVPAVIPQSLVGPPKVGTATEPDLNIPEKVLMAVTPLAKMTYEDQLKKKESDVGVFLGRFRQEFLNTNRAATPWIKLQEKRCNCFLQLDKFVPSPQVEGYRNKCDFTIGSNEAEEPTIGFLVSPTLLVVGSVEHLIHVPDQMKVICKGLQTLIRSTGIPVFDSYTTKGFWMGLTIRISTPGEIMVIIAVNGQSLQRLAYKGVKDAVKAFFESGAGMEYGVTSLYFNDKLQWNPGILEHMDGDMFINEEIFGKMLQISPKAFFPINPFVMENMYNTISELLKLNDDCTLIDLCCGTGSISLSLADRVGQILGIDVLPEAVEDARMSALKNDITNCEFFVGSAEENLGQLWKRVTFSETVCVLDPPKTGLEQKAIYQIRKNSQIKKLVYIASDCVASTKNFLDLCRPPSNKVHGDPMIPVRAIPVDTLPHTNYYSIIFLFLRIPMDSLLTPENIDPSSGQFSEQDKLTFVYPAAEESAPDLSWKPVEPPPPEKPLQNYFTRLVQGQHSQPQAVAQPVTDPREFELSKEQRAWLQQMSDMYGTQFERYQWVTTFQKQNAEAARKAAAAAAAASAAAVVTPVPPMAPTYFQTPAVTTPMYQYDYTQAYSYVPQPRAPAVPRAVTTQEPPYLHESTPARGMSTEDWQVYCEAMSKYWSMWAKTATAGARAPAQAQPPLPADPPPTENPPAQNPPAATKQKNVVSGYYTYPQPPQPPKPPT